MVVRSHAVMCPNDCEDWTLWIVVAVVFCLLACSTTISVRRRVWVVAGHVLFNMHFQVWCLAPLKDCKRSNLRVLIVFPACGLQAVGQEQEMHLGDCSTGGVP